MFVREGDNVVFEGALQPVRSQLREAWPFVDRRVYIYWSI